MALWRDPLDELIGELMRTLPHEAGPANGVMPRFEMSISQSRQSGGD
jgi:hypothetical protein